MENHLIPMDHDACGVGFVTQLGGAASHEIVKRALEALNRLAHRGGVDADGRSGDGAGLLTAIPDRFIRQRARELGLRLPPIYAVGMAFVSDELLPDVLATASSSIGIQYLGERTVPV